MTQLTKAMIIELNYTNNSKDNSLYNAHYSFVNNNHIWWTHLKDYYWNVLSSEERIELSRKAKNNDTT